MGAYVFERKQCRVSVKLYESMFMLLIWRIAVLHPSVHHAYSNTCTKHSHQATQRGTMSHTSSSSNAASASNASTNNASSNTITPPTAVALHALTQHMLSSWQQARELYRQ